LNLKNVWTDWKISGFLEATFMMIVIISTVTNNNKLAGFDINVAFGAQ
jgi:hypothetical protein